VTVAVTPAAVADCCIGAHPSVHSHVATLMTAIPPAGFDRGTGGVTRSCAKAASARVRATTAGSAATGSTTSSEAGLPVAVSVQIFQYRLPGASDVTSAPAMSAIRQPSRASFATSK